MIKTLFLGSLALCSLSLFLTPKLFETPPGWPEPQYDFSRNPLTQDKVKLGRLLFYEPLLSRDSSISCASCHLSFTAFTHVDHDLSHGIEGRVGTRNSPALVNLAWNKSFMWDGAINHLDMQALAPIHHPAEMDDSLPNVLHKLQDQLMYRAAFATAYGDSVATGEHLLKAMAQFLLTLVSADSKYDQVIRQEKGVAFTDQEERGLKLVRTNCGQCHPEPLFTNHEFMYNGLPVDTTLNDWGRMNISLNPDDSLKFKVPSLRNVEFSYPYMHDGRFRRLSDVLEHYQNGILPAPALTQDLEGGIELTDHERIDIEAFLLTLTDKNFLFNPAFSFPRE